MAIEGMAEFNRSIARALTIAVKEEAQQLPDLFAALIAESMHSSRNPGRNTTDKLYEGRGDLKRAWLAKGKGNRSSIAQSDTGVVAEFGLDESEIPYALIHEYGGTITITDKMRRFFWAKYYETGDDKWRWMALTPKTTITIPARPSFGPALEKLRTEEIPSIKENIYNRIYQLAN